MLYGMIQSVGALAVETQANAEARILQAIVAAWSEARALHVMVATHADIQTVQVETPPPSAEGRRLSWHIEASEGRLALMLDAGGKPVAMTYVEGDGRIRLDTKEARLSSAVALQPAVVVYGP